MNTFLVINVTIAKKFSAFAHRQTTNAIMTACTLEWNQFRSNTSGKSTKLINDNLRICPFLRPTISKQNIQYTA